MLQLDFLAGARGFDRRRADLEIGEAPAAGVGRRACRRWRRRIPRSPDRAGSCRSAARSPRGPCPNRPADHPATGGCRRARSSPASDRNAADAARWPGSRCWRACVWRPAPAPGDERRGTACAAARGCAKLAPLADAADQLGAGEMSVAVVDGGRRRAVGEIQKDRVRADRAAARRPSRTSWRARSSPGRRRSAAGCRSGARPGDR